MICNVRCILGRCVIHVLPEVSCKGLTKDDIPELVNKLYNIMQTEFDELNRKTIPLPHQKSD